GEELATDHSDAYKFGLLAIRLFAGDQSARDPDVLSRVAPELAALASRSLSTTPGQRPKPADWLAPLDAAIPAASLSLPGQPPGPARGPARSGARAGHRGADRPGRVDRRPDAGEADQHRWGTGEPGGAGRGRHRDRRRYRHRDRPGRRRRDAGRRGPAGTGGVAYRPGAHRRCG